jgi:hypothetical protein
MKTKVKFSNHIRAVSTDKRPLISEIESIAASMKNLSGPEKRKLVAAFADAGLLSGSAVNAASVDARGYYDIAAVDSAIKTFPTMTRIELKNALMRKGLLK